MLSNVEQHILEETFLTAVYVGKIISLSNENAQKEEMQLFPNPMTTWLFFCVEPFREDSSYVSGTASVFFTPINSSQKIG